MGRICAVMVPFLAFGHMIPFLRLSRMLAKRGATVVYVTTPSNVKQLRPLVRGWDVAIHFEELPMPGAALPPGCENTAQIPDEMMPHLEEAIQKLKDPFQALMEKLAKVGVEGLAPPEHLVLIRDVAAMGWSQTVAATLRVPCFVFIPVSACDWLWIKSICEPGEAVKEIVHILERTEPIPEYFRNAVEREMEFNRQARGMLIATFPEMEPRFLHPLLEEEQKPVWTVGPLVLPLSPTVEDEGHPCLEWLDRQSRASVVYISFGSESRISGAQIRELALGLEASNRPFLWVARPPLHSSASTDWKSEFLPPGFEARLSGRGFIECGWAPQTLILSHESTGAYITHCGWGSACEAVAAGVPMIAWPLCFYRKTVAAVLTSDTKVAVPMGNTMEDGDQLVTKEEVERAIRRLMLEEEGNVIKERMNVLSKAANRAIAEDEGSAWMALDSFLQFVIE